MIVGGVLLGCSILGSVYMLAAAIVFRAFFADPSPFARRDEAVTLLKPLRGDEPRLGPNLATFLDQDHDGPIEMICGVARADDPAIAVVRALAAERTDVSLVVDPTPHGANGKIANLINIDGHATHPVIVLSDSDMVASPDYLGRILAALDAPGVGAVTLLYRGRGDAGFWSVMGAAGLSYQFLPGAVFGVALGLAKPCMGSTIALSRDTLARIGGVARFADTLADDHAIGEAVRGLGLAVVVPPLLVTHASVERSFAELWRHELRWGATVRGIVPGAYVASVIAMPLPLAVLGTLVAPFHAVGGIAIIAAIVARTLVARAVDRQAGTTTMPLWLLPLRDCLSFAIFVASLFARSVDWRGDRLVLQREGRIVAGTESVL